MSRTKLATAVLFAASLLTAAPAALAQYQGVIPKKNLYPEASAAPAEVKAAFAQARRTHKRVLLDFGGDWCGDCQVLDIYFHQEPNAGLLSKYFVKVNVNIGHKDANLDIAKKYGVPVNGVPALAVVEPNGRIVVSQDKEFADMRHMNPESVTEFLQKYKK